MILSEVLRIGDEVILKVDSERRIWTDTYKDVLDGTKGVVCGFFDAVIYVPRVPVLSEKPGVYHQKGSVSIWLPDGRIVPGDWSVEMVDRDEERRRSAAIRDKNGLIRTTQVRLGDLPPTKFWEKDKVYVHFPNDEYAGTIGRIDYNFMHKHRDNGSPWPFYDINLTQGGTMSAEESWIELVERGNVWKYYHDEPLTFTDLKEEADFFQLIGQTEDVCNPKNNLYSWTKEEALEAIRNGLAHGFTAGSSFFTGFGGRPHLNAKRFKNEELGKRVAQATLEGHGLALI